MNILSKLRNYNIEHILLDICCLNLSMLVTFTTRLIGQHFLLITKGKRYSKLVEKSFNLSSNIFGTSYIYCHAVYSN